MKIFLNILGVLLVLVGGVWFLQGERVLMGSPMSGQSQWVYNGALVVLIGLVLLGINNLWKRPARKP